MTDINPYEPPKTPGAAATPWSSLRLWLWCASSVAASVLSLALFYLYGHWHWHRVPWAETLPGRMGLSWITAVDGSKEFSVLFALISLCITITIFRKKGFLPGLVSLPTCLLSVMTIPVQT
jgi:hypothetical protein